MGDPQDVTADRILRELLMPNRNDSNATITVNAGGAGVWACVTACLIMFVLSMVMVVAYLDVRDEQRVTAAHLATIYVLVPGLREQVQDILNKKEGK